ncbi:MAG: hypothetical protein FJ102_17270 [Deltaproteobacteria bacterium]|nr:hypothetical protein [Deltaproteobacteria bacterium]
MFFALAILACTGNDDEQTDSGGSDTADSAEDAEVIPVWEQHRIETSSTLYGVYASGAGVYVVGDGGYAWSGGADDDWAYMSIDVDDANLTDLWGQGQNDDTILAASTNDGKVAQYAGGTWTTGSLDDTSALEAVGGSSSSALYAVGFGRAWYYDGATWTYEALPGNERLNDVYAEGSSAIAVGDAGDCALRRDGAWSACDTGTELDLNGVAGTSADDVYAVGAAGLVLHWDGSSWRDLEAPTSDTDTLWAVFVPEEGVAVVVGSNGLALKYANGDWESLPTGVDNALYSIHGVSSSNFWAGGNRGMMLHYKSE